MPDRDQQGQHTDYPQVEAIARALADNCDLDQLLKVIVNSSTELLATERAELFLYDADRRELRGPMDAAGVPDQVPLDAGIVGACAREMTTIHVPQAAADPRLAAETPRTNGFVPRNLVAVPLRDLEGRLVGVLRVFNKRGGPFTGEDLRRVESLGAQAGVALQRAVLLDRFTAKQQLDRSLAIARDIQQGLFPKHDPQLEGWELAGFNRPAEETGGDAYDFFELGQGRLGMLLADATGHGVGPALVVAQTRAMVRALALLEANIPPLMATVNSLLAVDLASERFVTCFFGVAHAGRGTLKYLSAGQGPMLVYRSQRDTFETLKATSPPLGVVPEVAYDHLATLELKSGDFFALTTDGYYETTSPQGEPFGLPRIFEHLRAGRRKSARQMILDLTSAVDQFRQGRPQLDDLTAIIARKT